MIFQISATTKPGTWLGIMHGVAAIIDSEEKGIGNAENLEGGS